MNSFPSEGQINTFGNQTKNSPNNINDKYQNNQQEYSQEPSFSIKVNKEIEANIEDEEEEIKKENNTKKKLFTALNNINDEINVKIDSKDKFKNTVLDLNYYINRPSLLMKKNTFEKNNESFNDNNNLSNNNNNNINNNNNNNNNYNANYKNDENNDYNSEINDSKNNINNRDNLSGRGSGNISLSINSLMLRNFSFIKYYRI